MPVFAQDSLLNQAWQQSVPRVPPLQSVSVNQVTKVGGEYGLDGIYSTNDRFEGVTFKYGGGAYNLSGSVIIPPVNLQLIGAAANTAQLLRVFGMLGCPAKQGPPATTNPNTPILEKAALQDTFRGNLVSPYNGSQQ
jgi:hypothetical protein